MEDTPHQDSTPADSSPPREGTANEILPLVYDELKQLAHHRMSNEPSGHLLQTTALVHEAYLRLTKKSVTWTNNGHFFGAAARAMRRILVEWARREKNPLKRAQTSVQLNDLAAQFECSAVDLLALDEALTELEGLDRRKHEMVMLRYFAGLSVEETANTLGVSAATCHRDWSYARAWLHDRITGAAPHDPKGSHE